MVQTSIDYSKLGNVVLYTGLRGAGSTSAAVRHVKNLDVSSIPNGIVSNIHLNGIPYKPFGLDFRMLRHLNNCVVLLDAVWTLVDTRILTRRSSFIAHFLYQCKTKNIKLVLTSNTGIYLDKRVKLLITDELVCSTAWYESHPILTMYHTKGSNKSRIYLPEELYLIKDIRGYFGSFDTFSKVSVIEDLKVG